MSRSKSSKRPLPPEVDDHEEIEILEIVGVDEEHPAPGAVAPAEVREEEIDNGYVLDLDVPSVSEAVEGEAGDRDRLVRLQADFENFKKRVERESEATRRQATARLVTELLPVLDNFERAVAAKPTSPEDSTFHAGFALIFRQLLEALRNEGLTAIDSLGQPFDPNLHEAVATESDSDLPSNTIVEEMQRGYMLNHRLLRPALVKVSMGSPGDPRSEGGEGP